MNFFNLAKPKKMFEKLNKMDRKQAYTVGAIIVVAVISLLMLVSSVGSSEDPMEEMNPRGYDLASMPFVNDEAEKMLLASYYPDMKENSGSFLYTPLEREQREQEDQENEEDSEEGIFQQEEDLSYSNDDRDSSDTYSSQTDGYSRGRGYGSGRGRGTTEIGRLDKGSMATGSGSGIGSTWGPSVDNRGFQGQTGYVAPAQVQTSDGRKALQQFRAGSFQASRLRDNKMLNARKAMQGGPIQGSQAFGKDGSIDVSKLGGLALDTSELPKTTDLNNLDDAVDNAVKDAQKKEEKDKKLGFWEQLGQDMLRSFATGLVDAVTTGVGDSLKGWVNGNAASRAARKQAGYELAGKNWGDLSIADQNYFKQQMVNKMGWTGTDTWTDAQWNTAWSTNQGSKEQAKIMRGASSARAEGKAASAKAQAEAWGTTPAPSKSTSKEKSSDDKAKCLESKCGDKKGEEYTKCVYTSGC